jgi:hypothetical protein
LKQFSDHKHHNNIHNSTIRETLRHSFFSLFLPFFLLLLFTALSLKWSTPLFIAFLFITLPTSNKTFLFLYLSFSCYLFWKVGKYKIKRRYFFLYYLFYFPRKKTLIWEWRIFRTFPQWWKDMIWLQKYWKFMLR